MYSTVEQTGLQQYSGLSGGFSHIYEKYQNVLRYRGGQDRLNHEFVQPSVKHGRDSVSRSACRQAGKDPMQASTRR